MNEIINKSNLRPSIQSPAVLADMAQMWRSLMNEITHSLFNKLAILQLCQISIDRDLPTLIEGYSLAVQHKLIDERITTEQLTLFTELIDLKEHIAPIQQVFKTLLQRCAELGKNEPHASSCLAADCVEKMIASYPFGTQNPDLLKLNLKNDFALAVSPVLINTLLTELLDFANFCMGNPSEVSQGDKIEISLKTEQYVNTMHCKIVTTNITANQCKNFSERIFKSASQDLLPGFGWCRLAMMHAGGEIAFIVNEKTDVEFIITFPK